jgi:protein-S-isoprenylcysteine O-methyltransferase Ste14
VRHVIFLIAANLVAAAAWARVAGIVIGALRSLANRRRFVEFAFGPIELATNLEPLALAVALLTLFPDTRSPSSGELAAALGGAVLSLAGIGLLAWALLSWRQLFVGHGVLVDHDLVTGGAYGVVRHPVYLGAFLIWAGLSLAFLSPVAGIFTLVYVLPVYLLYIRSEETMMVARMGEPYRAYRESVPALLPRIRSRT